MKDPPPFIQDVLDGKRCVYREKYCERPTHLGSRDPKSRLAECLLIDFDNSAILDKKGSLPIALEELAHRTVRLIAKLTCYICSH